MLLWKDKLKLWSIMSIVYYLKIEEFLFFSSNQGFSGFYKMIFGNN
jgi:hypothetical protein